MYLLRKPFAGLRPRAIHSTSPGRRCLAMTIVLFWLTFAAAPAFADLLDGQPWWPQFHGPQRDNISRETGLLKQWPAEGPKLLWKFAECGNGYSGVSIADGKIYTAGDFDEIEKIFALDMDGRPLWQTTNGASWLGPYPGSRTTPTYSDGLLFQMNPKGRLAAYQAATGKEVWIVDLVKEYGARYGIWSMAENLVVQGERLYCVPGGSRALVVALDKQTGKNIWTNASLNETAAYCSPILVTHKGVDQLITLAQKSVIGVDVHTGKLLWSHPHVTRHDQNVNAPVFSDGYVFTASGHSGGGRLIQLDAESAAAAEVWWDKALDNCHGSVMLLDGHLYGSSCRAGGKGFFCADFLTGEERFREKKMAKLSLTVADGMIYAVTQKGEMMLINPRPDKLDIVSRFQTPDDTRALAWAHPVVCGGRLYIRRGSYLYVYDVRAN
jgi:outer membrane protein assembly factor BamB